MDDQKVIVKSLPGNKTVFSKDGICTVICVSKEDNEIVTRISGRASMEGLLTMTRLIVDQVSQHSEKLLADGKRGMSPLEVIEALKVLYDPNLLFEIHEASGRPIGRA